MGRATPPVNEVPSAWTARSAFAPQSVKARSRWPAQCLIANEHSNHNCMKPTREGVCVGLERAHSAHR